MGIHVLLCFLGINLFLCYLHLCHLGNHRAKGYPIVQNDVPYANSVVNTINEK